MLVDQTAQLGRRRQSNYRDQTRGYVTELVTRYRDGATVYDLADRFCIHRTTVSQHVHRGGVKMRRRGLDDRQVELAIRLYQRGWSVARIGSYCDVNGGTVWLALRGRGVRMSDAKGRER